MNDRSEDKPKAGLFRRLFGGRAARAGRRGARAADRSARRSAAARAAAAPASRRRSRGAEPAGAASRFGRWFGRGEAARTAAPAPKRRGAAGCRGCTSGLSRSSSAIGRGIADIFTKRKLDADLARRSRRHPACRPISASARRRASARRSARGATTRASTPEEVKRLLAEEVERTLAPVARPLDIDAAKKPFVILVVGVNGSGKTTTIGKLAAKFAAEGAKVMLAAGDTFRAAAIEQLRIWGEPRRRPRSSRASRAATRRASPSTR